MCDATSRLTRRRHNQRGKKQSDSASHDLIYKFTRYVKFDRKFSSFAILLLSDLRKFTFCCNSKASRLRYLFPSMSGRRMGVATSGGHKKQASYIDSWQAAQVKSYLVILPQPLAQAAWFSRYLWVVASSKSFP
jgi:hypothetical protein